MKHLLRLLLPSLVLLLLSSTNALSRTVLSPIRDCTDAPFVQVPDTLSEEDIIGVLLPEIHVSGTPHKPLTKTERYAYWRRVRDVKKVLPIAEELSRMITETYEYAETFPTERERKAHLARVKKELVKEYTPRMKNLTLGQGLLLIKLMNRQTGSTGYEIVKSIYGGLTATWYNTLAKIYGGNLDMTFDPEHVEDDAVTERIIYLWRNGLL
ncbi:MAG: DUF4294 domain-containing protein [Porphyromonas sp.]|uniref:DUF4294 domain-containing protein n=1 Tax=Porphyromonas sp. TaxID=1924944 RepID=UPI001A497AC9|nr:DUF4294 domain-containing protein [Porphyromonas sp.]MBL6453471.1 DUF4294 domain-containing protein [Porphyromonas sp.]